MNNQICIVVAEDEAPLRHAFVEQLSSVWPDAQIVAECADGASAIEAVNAHQPDVVFLDIKMPKLSGLEVAKVIGGRAFVVFTTAYDKYAVAAFESGAVDYLLKPISSDRLEDTIARLKTRLGHQQPPNLEALVQELQSRLAREQEPLKWVTASSGNTTKMIAIDDVLYFQSEQKYTKVVTASSSAIIRTSLKDLMERLDANDFWQVHRSAIVAIHAIDSIKKNELGAHLLTLRDHADTLPTSKDFQRKFKAL